MLAAAPLPCFGVAELPAGNPAIMREAGGGRAEQARASDQPGEAASHALYPATVVGTPFRLARGDLGGAAQRRVAAKVMIRPWDVVGPDGRQGSANLHDKFIKKMLRRKARDCMAKIMQSARAFTARFA